MTVNSRKESVENFSTIPDFANDLHVSTKTVRRWIETGDLVAHRFGNQLRISREDRLNFIRARRQG